MRHHLHLHLHPQARKAQASGHEAADGAGEPLSAISLIAEVAAAVFRAESRMILSRSVCLTLTGPRGVS